MTHTCGPKRFTGEKLKRKSLINKLINELVCSLTQVTSLQGQGQVDVQVIVKELQEFGVGEVQILSEEEDEEREEKRFKSLEQFK